jgi:hypothetical protein
MPLLEVTQVRHVSASIRLTDTTAILTDQYALFIHACADDVIEQALTYAFSKDRDFQEFLKTPVAVVGRSQTTYRGRREGSLFLWRNRVRKQWQEWRDQRHDPPSRSVAKPQRCFAPEED